MVGKPGQSLDQPKRPRNAVATRGAILHSALAAFSRSGYDGIGVREIAQAAGVTAVLVNRYFGSKEELFAAAVEIAFADSSLFDGSTFTLAQRLTAAVMTKTEKDAAPIDPLLLLLRSAPNPRAAEILRDGIARHFERPLKTLLQGPKANERAALILALIAGFQLMRKVIGCEALSDADSATVCGELRTMFKGLIDSSASGESPIRRSRVKKREQ